MNNKKLFESILTEIYKYENKMFFVKKRFVIDKKYFHYIKMQQCDKVFAYGIVGKTIDNYTRRKWIKITNQLMAGNMMNMRVMK